MSVWTLTPTYDPEGNLTPRGATYMFNTKNQLVSPAFQRLFSVEDLSFSQMPKRAGESAVTFEEMQADFIARRKGVPSLPITGIINYSAAALLSLVVAPTRRNLVLAICFWAIPPVAAMIGRIRGEQMTGNPENPLFRLATLARLMVLATWAIHIPIWIYAPDLFPLTVGIAFALHWVVFSWSIGQPVGFVHLALRVVLVPAAWLAAPDNRMGAVAAAVAACYAISVWQLSRIDWSTPRDQPV